MKKSILSAALVALLSSHATADTNFYLGAGVGQTSVDYAPVSGVTVTDDSDTSWKLFAGYEFNQNFAVEFAYQDLGTNTAVTSGNTVNLDAESYSLALVGKYPLTEKLEALGKLGYAHVDAEAAASGVAVSADDSDLLFGLGMNYQVTDTVDVRLEWERMNFADEIDSVTLGVSFGF